MLLCIWLSNNSITWRAGVYRTAWIVIDYQGKNRYTLKSTRGTEKVRDAQETGQL